MKRVFLGGTCNESLWRAEMEGWLDGDNIAYFNPVVDDWTEEAQKQEIEERATCSVVMYCITPKMTGVYSIAEVVDDSNKQPDKTVLVVLDEDDGDTFTDAQQRSLKSVIRMVRENGGYACTDLPSAATFIATGVPQ